MVQNKLEYKIVDALLKYKLISKDQEISLKSLLDDTPKEGQINVGFALVQPRFVNGGHYEEWFEGGRYVGFFQRAFFEPPVKHRIYVEDNKFENLWLTLYDCQYGYTDGVSLTKKLTDMVLKTIKEDHVIGVIIKDGLSDGWSGGLPGTEVQIEIKYNSGFDLLTNWQNATGKKCPFYEKLVKGLSYEQNLKIAKEKGIKPY
jgi:hypothetical protein